MKKAGGGHLFGLLRHGETVWNREHRVQGHGDSPLTEEGRRRLGDWARYLATTRWDRILASDLGRVRATIAILNEVLQLPVTFDRRLREQHWGDWEGMKVADVKRDYASELAAQIERGWYFQPPGGEDRRSVYSRAIAALDIERSRHPGGRTLVVCHLGVIKCLVYGISGCSFLPDENVALAKNAHHHILYEQDNYRLGPLNLHPGEAP